MMKYFSFWSGLLLLFLSKMAFAQMESVTHTGELGIQTGAAHYFGDLNTATGLKRPHPSFGLFYRKQVNNYAAFRVALNYAQLSYADRLQATNEFQRRRNLDFKTAIWEFVLQGDFNFFRFDPEVPGQRFTPYLTFGLGLFQFDPYTYYEGQKYFLRPLGTEGQNSVKFPGSKEYSNTGICTPVGFGIKAALNRKINIHFELTHRFTNTDYMDDVSGNYAGADAFLPGSAAFFLQDRSAESGAIIGKEGNQRGFKGNKDQYIIANLGITFSFSSYRCPGAN
jgi:hypothetical protein